MIMMMIVMSKYFDKEDFSYGNKDVAPAVWPFSHCIFNFVKFKEATESQPDNYNAGNHNDNEIIFNSGKSHLWC